MAIADLGFRGEIADLYHRYRHGYRPAVLDAITGIFGLTNDDLAVDVGCGTGQLTLPMAARVRAVIGVDPERDMLQRARDAARDAGVANVTWMLGADIDLPTIRALLGDGSVGVVTVGQALHWMDHRTLFANVAPLLRPGGGIAVVTNGTPLWLHDTDWSRALRQFLEQWLNTEIKSSCGTDDQSQTRYREALAAAGYEVHSAAVDYDVELTLDELVGGLYSALGVDRLPPPSERPAVAEQVRRIIAPRNLVTEHVHVAILAGRMRRQPPAHS
jgi:SAM-dependent methyltransferase